MMELVINEWFPEYCKPETPKENKELLRSFLEKFLNRNDFLVVRNPSAFLTKIHRYTKEYRSHNDTYSISILNFFTKQILLNSQRCRFIDDDCDLSENILVKLSQGNFSSDQYLFEAASTTEEKIIITTDIRLCNHINNTDGYQLKLLHDFLSQY